MSKESRKVKKMGPHKVEFIAPCKKLKNKAGSGGIPDSLVERGQSFIKNNDVDFAPFAKQYIDNIETYIEKLRGAEGDEKKRKHSLNVRQEIMQLKAHGGMFNYGVISQISGLVLKVVEKTDVLNDDLLTIIMAHNRAIHVIIATKIKSETDVHAVALSNELQGVITRYLNKYK